MQRLLLQLKSILPRWAVMVRSSRRLFSAIGANVLSAARAGASNSLGHTCQGLQHLGAADLVGVVGDTVSHGAATGAPCKR